MTAPCRPGENDRKGAVLRRTLGRAPKPRTVCRSLRADDAVVKGAGLTGLFGSLGRVPGWLVRTIGRSRASLTLPP